MTLKTKILLGYGLAFALMSLVFIWAIINLVSLGHATNTILSENYRSIIAAENMIDALERQDSGVLLLFLGDTEEGIRQFRQNEAAFYEWLGRAKDNITIRGERDVVTAIDREYAEYRTRFSGVTELGPANVPAQPSLTVYREVFHPLFKSVRDVCVQLRNLNEATMYSASVRAGGVAKRAIWSTTAAAVAALVVALGFSLLLAERVVGPLRRFMDAARRISSGDYGIEIPVETGDELGHLAGEFNKMAQQLNRYHEMNIDQILAEKNKGDAILASIEDALILFDLTLQITGINPAARRLLKPDSPDGAMLRITDLLPDPGLCDLIRETVMTGRQPDIPDEERIITLDPGSDSPRHFLFSITAIHGRDGNLTGIVLLLRDVTRLREVERLKSDFVMAASHELRTPLTSLGMSIDLLAEHASEMLGRSERELLFTAQEEVHRMKALVNDLLNLSKLETGKIELEFESIGAGDLFEHVRQVFHGQMEMKGIHLEIERVDELPVIRADATKITWVLTNLISNALRYVDEGGHIRLSARKTGVFLHLSVQDDGQGIPAEYQDRIFQKFVQVKGRHSGGTGLGLAICREIVRAHGGTIWVESEPSRGSTFTFTIPLA